MPYSFWIITFAFFAVPFLARTWRSYFICFVGLIGLLIVMKFALRLPMPFFIVTTTFAGLAMRALTLFLRKKTRARLAAQGLAENARVAGRKLTLIGLFAGYPVWMALAQRLVF